MSQTSLSVLSGSANDDLIAATPLNDNIYAMAGDDTIWAGTGDIGHDTIVGDLGDDVIGGGAGNDFIIGDGVHVSNADSAIDSTQVNETGPEPDMAYIDDAWTDGADTIYGGAGNDVIVTGSWDDTREKENGKYDLGEHVQDFELDASFKSDLAYGGAGHDTIAASSGNDTLRGGAGHDVIRGGNGNDYLLGGVGRDDIDGESGNDMIYGGAGDDTLRGHQGNDLIKNGLGDDVVDGNTGEDTLHGGAGNDTLTGDGIEDGYNYLVAPSDRDVFIFKPGDGHDIVTDFEVDVDVLDLSAFGFADLAAVEATAVTDGRHLVIEADDGTSITLMGLDVSDLASMTVLL